MYRAPPRPSLSSLPVAHSRFLFLSFLFRFLLFVCSLSLTHTHEFHSHFLFTLSLQHTHIRLHRRRKWAQSTTKSTSFKNVSRSRVVGNLRCLFVFWNFRNLFYFGIWGFVSYAASSPVFPLPLLSSLLVRPCEMTQNPSSSEFSTVSTPNPPSFPPTHLPFPPPVLTSTDRLILRY